MPLDNEPMDIARKNAATSVRLALSKRNLNLSIGGKDTNRDALPPFSPQEGFWETPGKVTPKPPRWLFWLEQTDGVVTARVPQAHGTDRLMFLNTGDNRKAGIFTRVVPVIRQPSGQWHLYLGWEWVLFFVMPRALKPGTAAQVLEHFNPTDGSFDYLYRTGENNPVTNKPVQKREKATYVAGGLFKLLPSSDTYISPESGAVPITYEAATTALQQLINVSPLIVTILPDTEVEETV